ncbi:hypothetical protein [Aquibium sp. ELW1220]|uniref:hypothetical protein n=1 Tax=Aquibium sp. ELW1220 TaxID=2976766 RepID=UPI0025B27BF7|nr:hypothetical protein [Aquibium sp. ELW1220]MDN2582273.1 hypothetical protein [Aquibium sp. ELW1220]
MPDQTLTDRRDRAARGASRRSGRARRAGAAIAVLIGGAGPGLAACPQELAVYTDRDKAASIEFRPVAPDEAIYTGEFRVLFSQNGIVADGIVMWTDGVPRPTGIVMHDCPEGDVTGAELAACTIWQGVIYAIDAAGEVGLLPREGPAAERLLLPDFGPSVRHSALYGADGISIVPWDVFEISGCQE